MISRRFFWTTGLFAMPLLALWGAEAEKRPLLVVLHSRFEDHITIGVGEDRLFRLISLVEKLRKDYSAYPVSVSCEFSGAFLQRLTMTPTGRGYMDRLKELTQKGWVEIGYSGEHEPTYRNRPKAAVDKNMTAEQRWQAQTEAAARLLTEYKDHTTGQLDPKRPGGMSQIKQTLGDPTIIASLAAPVGGEAPYYHQMRKMNLQPVVPGFPDPYFTMNIHGFRGSAAAIGEAMSAGRDNSPEVFWDSNFLRLSATDKDDIRRFSAEEGKEALGKLLEKLDRSHVRVLQIEVAGYARYLAKWPDGTPKLFPLVWAYDYPEDPELPNGIKAFLASGEIYKSYEAEEAALRWLLGEFLPGNRGSRVVGPKELLAAAQTPVGRDFTPDELRIAAQDWLARSQKLTNLCPTFVQAGETYLSSADLFQLLANSLAGRAAGGTAPAKLRLTHIYGPLYLESTDETFPTISIPAREVMRVAAGLAPALNDQTWRAVPGNAVPVRVEIAGKRILPAQFLALMVDAYLAPTPDTPLKLKYFQEATSPGLMFPRQNGIAEGGHVWTLRPAPLAFKEARSEVSLAR